jgi:8-oxo-dGTP diphosphatase
MKSHSSTCPKCYSDIDVIGRSIPKAKLTEFSGPNLATDSVCLRKHKDNNFHDILLITRLKDPYKGRYAFPGGFVDYNEDPAVACMRELKEECNLDGISQKLITVAGNPKRDPRKHIVSFVYEVVVADTAIPKAGDDAATAKFFDLIEMLKLKDKFAFDHYEILSSHIKANYSQYNGII